MHSVHTVAPAFETLPAGHGLQVATCAPAEELLYLPDSHETQPERAEAPVPLNHLPAGHAAHWEAPVVLL